jgi:hypothetical protein
VLNWGIWLAFLIEAVVMLAVVPDRGRWLRQHPIEVIVVVLTPPFLPATLQAARLLRLLRLLRLVPLLRLGPRFFSLEGLRYAALLALPPRPNRLDRPAATLAQAHAFGDVNPRDGKVAWRAFFRTEPEALEAVGSGSRRLAPTWRLDWTPGACVISQFLPAPKGRLLRSALR